MLLSVVSHCSALFVSVPMITKWTFSQEGRGDFSRSDDTHGSALVCGEFIWHSQVVSIFRVCFAQVDHPHHVPRLRLFHGLHFSS